MTNRAAGVWGIGSYVPEKILSNFDLEKMVDTSDEWITTRTGIQERRLAAPEQATSDLAYYAADKALADAGVKAEELDLIIVATSSPDHLFPATAALLQERLGAKKAGGFDLSVACSGYIYALAVAAQFVATGLHEKVLVVGAETLSRIVNFEDRGTAILFGDGAGAMVIGPVEAGYGLMGHHLGLDGSGAELLSLPAGGSREPLSEEVLKNKRQYVDMNGKEVYKFAVNIMGDATLKVLETTGLTPEDIDLYVPHQANYRIIEASAKRFNFPMEKVLINIHKYGNVSTATIPLAIDEAYQEGRIKEGDNLLLVAFGGGLSWAASLLRWGGRPEK